MKTDTVKEKEHASLKRYFCKKLHLSMQDFSRRMTWIEAKYLEGRLPYSVFKKEYRCTRYVFNQLLYYLGKGFEEYVRKYLPKRRRSSLTDKGIATIESLLQCRRLPISSKEIR